MGGIENAVLATGHLVGARVSGEVKSLNSKLSKRVTKEQTIADIDDQQHRIDLRKAEAALNVIKARPQTKQAQLVQAESRFNPQRSMLNNEASSCEDFETAETTLTITRAEQITLNASLVQVQIKVDKKQIELEYTHIVAPMYGIVIAVATPQGQTVNFSQEHRPWSSQHGWI